MGIVPKVPYHRARIESFYTLHDLGLTLLATVLLPVDSGISKLLHHLNHSPIITGFIKGATIGDVFTSHNTCKKFIESSITQARVLTWINDPQSDHLFNQCFI